jgi:hypothetical protein
MVAPMQSGADDLRLIYVSGRPMWVDATGRTVPHVAGGDGPDDPPPPAPPAPPAPPEPAPAPPAPPVPTPPAGVSAEQLSQIQADARAAAQREFEAWLTEQGRQQDLQSMSEADRRVAEAQQREQAAAQRETAAAAEALNARASLALLAGGVQLPPVPTAEQPGPDPQTVLAAHVRALGLVPGATDEQIAAALATHRSAFPGSYAAAPAPGIPAPPPGIPAPRPPAGGTPAKTGIERGRARARNARPEPSTDDPFRHLRSA